MEFICFDVLIGSLLGAVFMAIIIAIDQRRKRKPKPPFEKWEK